MEVDDANRDWRKTQWIGQHTAGRDFQPTDVYGRDAIGVGRPFEQGGVDERGSSWLGEDGEGVRLLQALHLPQNAVFGERLRAVVTAPGKDGRAGGIVDGHLEMSRGRQLGIQRIRPVRIMAGYEEEGEDQEHAALRL